MKKVGESKAADRDEEKMAPTLIVGIFYIEGDRD